MGTASISSNDRVNKSLMSLPTNVQEILREAPSVRFPNDTKTLEDIALGGNEKNVFEVSYILGENCIGETKVIRAKNGIASIPYEPEMRRRDPNTMVIGDDLPTDKQHFRDRFGYEFSKLKPLMRDWLKKQRLVVLAVNMGQLSEEPNTLVIAPENAGYYLHMFGLIQGIIPFHKLSSSPPLKNIFYVTPTFRHSHFNGKQVVIHVRGEIHEIFSSTLYPGPGAKKGGYAALLHQAEEEGWEVSHCSVVQVTTPYGNKLVFEHHGASGGGKSENTSPIHREDNGTVMIGRNIVTKEIHRLTFPSGSCSLNPVVDDMACCHPSFQCGDGRRYVQDAEAGWFVRTNHIQSYGTEPFLEAIVSDPNYMLAFMNLLAVPGGRVALHDHAEDAPGKKCPNPRVIIPRRLIPGIVDGPVAVDVSSFGIRTPACTGQRPTYGIIGYLHLLPPALAWLWRLVAPRGHDNPSINNDTTGDSMASEGVGSFWPFATGKRVRHANLILRQIVETKKVIYPLFPNQYVGPLKVGFMPQHIGREYLARRGLARFEGSSIEPAKCSLLGWIPSNFVIEGHDFPRQFLHVNEHHDVGDQAYNIGAEILEAFFKKHLPQYIEQDLDPLGKEIINCCMGGGRVADYEGFIPMYKN